MKFKFIHLLPLISCFFAGSASANWQYPGTYLGDGWYQDDGSRFMMSLRGGVAIGGGKIHNEIGSLTTSYYIDQNTGVVVSEAYYDACTLAGYCDDFVLAGMGDLANLPAGQKLSTASFAAGFSLGWSIPHSPQWRVEAGWDHISESEYNAIPLFDGDLTLDSGAIVNVQSGAAHSITSTDVISLMVFHDFFDGIRKPIREFIPYVGLGFGYAESRTTLNLSDLYGDLSWSVDLQNYGELDDYDVLQFYTSKKTTANIAGLLALGGSYGLDNNLFIDLGVRLTYIPKIKWALSNVDGNKHRDWFSARSVIYTNIMLGIRYEF